MFQWRVFRLDGAEPGAYLTVPSLERAGIRVAFTARAGGVSARPYEGLNLSFVSGDDPDAVRANRRRALGAIGVDLGAWTSARQVHGARAAAVTPRERGRGATDPDDTIEDTDALWTDEPGVALAVLTADCAPILIADPQTRRIAVVHAGWRGLAAGVVGAAAEAFEDRSRAQAFVGPAIGPCCYEVGDDVAQPLVDAFGASVVRAAEPRPHADLWTAARIALHQSGITSVTLAALCTRSSPHRFFSHRAGDAARQGLVATIEP